MSTPDKKKIKAIIGFESAITPDEAQGGLDATTADDHEASVINAIERRAQGGIALTAEHPTSTVFRRGIESIKAGKTSDVFVRLLEDIANAADERNLDALSLTMPHIFKPITDAALRIAKRDKKIADDYREAVKDGDAKGHDLREIKYGAMTGFVKRQNRHGNDIKTVERALKKYELNIQVTRPGRPKKA